MDLRCAVSLPRGIALRWMVILSSTGFTGCGNSASFHSERSEESLPIENKRPRGILRANSALRMTVFRFFPQPVQPVYCRRAAAQTTQAEESVLPDGAGHALVPLAEMPTSVSIPAVSLVWFHAANEA